MSLSFQDLNVAYGTTSVLRSLSDQWPTGQLTALIGCNGAGKSTLLKAVAGLIPSTGHLHLDDAEMSLADRRRHIAYMPQDTSAASSLTVLEVVLLGKLGSLGMRLPASLVDEAMSALSVFGLTSLHRRRLDEISGGQRQLVYLSQAIFRQPRVLLLDEPTAALDLRHQLLVLERLQQHAREQGTVIGLAMHDLNLAAQFADRLIGLQDGQRVTAGLAEHVLTPENLRLMYGIDADVSLGAFGQLQVFPLHAAEHEARGL